MLTLAIVFGMDSRQFRLRVSFSNFSILLSLPDWKNRTDQIDQVSFEFFLESSSPLPLYTFDQPYVDTCKYINHIFDVAHYSCLLLLMISFSHFIIHFTSIIRKVCYQFVKPKIRASKLINPALLLF